MDQVVPCVLSPSGSPESGQEGSLGCAWRSAVEAAEPVAFLRAEETRAEAGGALGDWKVYALLTTIFVVALVFIGLFCFLSKYRNCTPSCVGGDPLKELEEDDIGIPWDTNLIDRPEPYGACMTPPQSISGGSARISRKEDVRLPFAPEDLGRRTARGSPSGALQGILGPGFTAETLDNRPGQDSSSETIFTIDDLE